MCVCAFVFFRTCGSFSGIETSSLNQYILYKHKYSIKINLPFFTSLNELNVLILAKTLKLNLAFEDSVNISPRGMFFLVFFSTNKL